MGGPLKTDGLLIVSPSKLVYLTLPFVSTLKPCLGTVCRNLVCLPKTNTIQHAVLKNPGPGDSTTMFLYEKEEISTFPAIVSRGADTYNKMCVCVCVLDSLATVQYISTYISTPLLEYSPVARLLVFSLDLEGR